MERTSTDVAPQRPTYDNSLETALRKFNDAFNRFDAKEVASCWADDGTLLNPVGNYGKGHAGVERVFREDAQTILAGSTSQFTITGARRIDDDCVLLDLDHEVQNFRCPDGTTKAMKLHVVMLARRQGNEWKWLDARPYAFLPREQQRLH